MSVENARLINSCYCRSNLRRKKIANDSENDEEENEIFVTVCSRTGKAISACENDARLRNNIIHFFPSFRPRPRPKTYPKLPPISDLRIGYYDQNGTWLRDER